jgi:hypothetical protein
MITFAPRKNTLAGKLIIIALWTIAIFFNEVDCYPCDVCECTTISEVELHVEVDCEKRNLTEVPSFFRNGNFSGTILNMKLDYNDIEVLRSDDFEGLTELTIL